MAANSLCWREMREPLVTIALPVYNGARHLRTALDDLLGQTFERFELVILDNASTDETPEIARAAAAADPRVSVVTREENVGGNANFNDGFERCRTRYFKWAAADDRHAPAFLERAVALLEQDSEAVFAFTGSDVIDEDGQALPYDSRQRAYLVDGEPWYHDFAAEETALSARPSARYRALLRSRITGTLVYGVFRSEALRGIPLFGRCRSDVHILAELALRGRFARAPETLFFRRLHPEATWNRNRRDIIQFENASAGVMAPPWGAAAEYARAALRARLPLAEKARCLAALAGYACRPATFRDLLIPGPNNYWGLGQPRASYPS
jgi:glycosyltransferase involved in cell wall biosynthesis